MSELRDVADELNGQWYKLMAAVMMKLAVERVDITEADITKIADQDIAVVCHAHRHSIEIRLMKSTDADALRRKIEAAGGVGIG